MITWHNVVAIAPELAAADPAQQAQILATVEREVSDTLWGDRANDGRCYLAAHLATLARMKGTGVVTAAGVGPLSRSYATPQGLTGSFGLTSYGAEFKRLIRLLPTTLGIVP